MQSAESYRGGCLCGAIRYSVEGPLLSTNVCYCTQCQRQTGAPLPAFLTVAARDLRLERGEPATYRSSPKATREFCARCGTCLFWREHGSDSVDVFLGSVDERERVPRPSFAIWSAHRVPWLPELEGVPSHPGARPETTPEP